jgi:hypothetical protein
MAHYDYTYHDTLSREGGVMSDKPGKAPTSNLLKWLEKHPEGSRFRHGAYARHTRKRYSDARTTEGKALLAVVGGIADDLGGMANLTSGQRLILDRIKEKLIVLWQIGQYVDKQPSVVMEGGELLPCLGRNYTGYSEAIRRDLIAIYDMSAARNKPSKVTDLAEYLRKKKEEKDGAGG